MEKQYDHQKLEPEMMRLWDGPTSPTATRGKGVFSIIMPPPNANDPLHLGHAMFVTVEDILIRFHRMLKDATLWMPGTDHAGIETQYVFEKKLNKEGKSRFSFDRETLYQMIWKYVQENSQTAITQMKRLGASADWSRTMFTLEPKVVDFVLGTFERMHQEGLIYRGLRLVNFCPKCGTGYSELEVIHVERNDPLYYIKYGPFELATVRPETKFGDTALAVNPNDKRYQEWIGKEIEVEGLLGRFKLKVIADDYVDPDFGTGVVKITPAHDPNDYEVGLRHQLPIKQVVGFDGKMTALAGPYEGMKVAEARKKVVEDLQARGLMSRVDDKYVHSVATCYRCGSIIEPLPLPQFFVKVKPLTEKVIKALDNREVKIYGAGHDKILRHWLTNLKDWNISRQIVWGIRIPVWYPTSRSTGPLRGASANENIQVGFLDQEKKFQHGKIGELLTKYSFEEIESGLQTLMAPKEATYVLSRTKPGEGYLQETDTFDTWFSSSQWPVVTLETQNLFKEFYPTSVMETSYDILPFWVMRMLMMGIYLTGKVPFKEVYLHGLIRDEKGQKMSKSKGNVINPMDLIEKYGADALRMALVMSSTAGHDQATGETKIRGMRNLGNKIWNATRFIKLSATSNKRQATSDNDKEYQKHLDSVVKTVTKQLNELKIGLAAETAYNEFWHWWCDEVIESYKRLGIRDKFLETGMGNWLKLLHPFVPFVTEAAWKELYPEELPLFNQSWPNSQ